MSTEAIRLVKDAEEQVQSIMEQARSCARQMKEEAAKEANEAYKHIRETAMTQADAMREQGRIEAKKMTEPILDAGKQEVLKIRGIGNDKIQPLVDSIVERIVNNHGNR